MADNQKFAQLQPFYLAGSGAVIGDTSITISNFEDIDGNELAMSNFGSKGWITLEPGNFSQEEQISFTGVTQNGNGTATLTGIKSVGFLYPYTETSGLAKTHAGGTTAVVSNTSAFYDSLASKKDDETIEGVWTFTNPNVPRMDVQPTYGVGTELYFATKQYVDDVAFAGAPNASLTQKGISQEATALQITNGTQTGSTGAELFVNPSFLASSIYFTQLPSAGQKSALAGVAGTPGATNPYETEYDTSNAATITALTISFTASTKTIADSANGFVTAGFRAGDAVTVTGTVSNNGTYTIVSVAAGAIVVAEALVNESAGSSFTLTAVTANKLARYTATSQLKVPLTPVATTDAVSKSYADSLAPAGTNNVIGTGIAAKTYRNYTVPIMINTGGGLSAALWVLTHGSNSDNMSYFFNYGTSSAPAGAALSEYDIHNGIGTQLTFAGTKKVVVEQWLQLKSTGTGHVAFGLCQEGALQSVYNSASFSAVMFTVSNAGNLYAHTSGGTGGADHTETQITGITLTSINVFRIEWNPGVNALFYVNGVLKATVATTLPTSGNMVYGKGCSGATDYVEKFGYLNVAVEI